MLPLRMYMLCQDGLQFVADQCQHAENALKQLSGHRERQAQLTCDNVSLTYRVLLNSSSM